MIRLMPCKADSADLLVVEGAGAPDALRLAQAFEAASGRWWELTRAMAGDGGALLAHTPSAAPNNSDLGLALAWTALLREAAERRADLVVRCADPWLFRHLAGLPGVQVEGRAPPLWPRTLTLALRGLAARARTAWRMARLAGAARPRPDVPPGAPAIMAYGHPQSRPDGFDAYFGPLMSEVAGLRRVLHTDAGADAIARLAEDARSESLHGWGSAWFALCRLPFARWRPSPSLLTGPDGWLVRRAAALEGGTGQGAAIAWQLHCQERWMAERKPAVIAWPWENHGWERGLIRVARRLGLRTIGHQHSVIGGQFNIGALGLADPQADLPEMVAANGPSGRRQLEARGVPPDRLADAGTLRFSPPPALTFDPAGPVLLAVPFDRVVAAQMIEAARPAARDGLTILVRDHPLFPVDFTPEENLTRSPGPLTSLTGVRAVVFAATTVGLEAVLAGLPVFRFIPAGRIAVNILPVGPVVPTVDAARLPSALAAVSPPPPPPAWTSIFSPADLSFWKEQLSP